MSLSTTLKCFLNTFTDSDCTTFPGSLFQLLTILSEKEFFLISSLSLLWCNLRSFPLVLQLIMWEKRLAFTLPPPPFKELERTIMSPLILLIYRLKTHSSLSQSSYDLCSSPLISLIALLWTCYRASMSCL